MFRLKRKLIMVGLLSLMFFGCAKNEPEAMVADSENASKFTYMSGAVITLIKGEEEIDLTKYTIEEKDSYMFSSDILTDIFSFDRRDDFEGYQKYIDSDNNTLLIGAGKDYILLNNEAVGLTGKVIKKDEKLYLPKDFFLALPGVTGMDNRRDGSKLIIKLI